MSGPKVIDYQAVERERAETARRRFRTLRGRAAAFEQRCVRSGEPGCAVAVPRLVGTDSADIERQCNALEAALAHAADELAHRQHDVRTKQVVAGLAAVLADLDRRERATAETHSATTAPVTVDFSERVARQLASLPQPSPDLERAAQSVLAAKDPDRARLLYADLAERVADVNRAAALLDAHRVEIAELRAHLETLSDPDPVRALLDHAAALAGRGEAVETQLRQARAAIAAQQDAAAAVADREFVRQAVAESLSELGYEVADVAVETADSLVYRQSPSHGVQARVRDGEIDVHTVRLESENGSEATDSDFDRAADDEFCRRLPGLLAALSRRGVAAGVKKRTLPGLIAPPAVALRTRRGVTGEVADTESQNAAARRTTR